MNQNEIAIVIGNLRKDLYNRKLASAVVNLALPEFTFHQVQIGEPER